jgi:hypothetical protein
VADNVTVDNGALTDYVASTKELSSSRHVIGVELVTAVSAGARTDLAKAEDSVHASGDMGLMALAVRADTAAATAADGDYHPLLVDSTGKLHVNAASVPAASRTTDSVAVAHQVDKLMNNLTAVTPVHVSVDVASSGDNTIVAAAGASNIIVVHQVFLVAASAVTVRFESGASGTALTGQMQLAANSGFVLPFSPVGWFRTAANTLLNLELSGAVSVDGNLTYSVVA